MGNIKLENIVYINSATDIYLKRQWDTSHCGPDYARSMGLKYKTLNANMDFEGFFFIDTILNEEECLLIEKKIQIYKESIFIFKIIDPYFEYEKEKYFFKTLFRVAKKPNVLFISNLEPKETTLELNAYTSFKKMLFLPYPYQHDKEIMVTYEDFSQRKNQICYSGAINPTIYPNRTKFIQKWYRNPLIWSKVSKLKHPGYLDKQNKVMHNVTGNYFINYLASYKIMFCDSSRANLEFVKFGECAYAHCLPFGEMPSSFDSEMQKYFIQINYNKFYKNISNIINIPDIDKYEISKNYRLIYQTHRNKKLLQSKLLDFINHIIN